MLRKRTESGPKLEELFSNLERRLIDYEDKSSKKFNDLDSKMGVMNNLLENHKSFLEELTEKKTKTSEEKVKNLFEKVYSQDSVCRFVKIKYCYLLLGQIFTTIKLIRQNSTKTHNFK